MQNLDIPGPSPIITLRQSLCFGTFVILHRCQTSNSVSIGIKLVFQLQMCTVRMVMPAFLDVVWQPTHVFLKLKFFRFVSKDECARIKVYFAGLVTL